MDSHKNKEVSIITPCFNEEETIGLLLKAIYNQSFSQEKIEVIISDGMSTDNTREVINDFEKSHNDLKIIVVDNPKRNIPSGLNLALEAASGSYIIRLDAHSIPSRDYIALCLEGLEQGLGDVVGGMWHIKPGAEGWIPRSIAVSASSPIGVGDARYRVGGQAQKVNTVPFGAYHSALIDRIGGYDESLLSNEDYEFNVRVKLNGGTIWMNPKISSIYFSRPTFRKLARQYWRYGYWKFKMLRKYPDTFRWRQMAGIFVLTWPVFGILSIWFPLMRMILLLEAVLYGSMLFFAGIQSAISLKDLAYCTGVPIAIFIMHFSWGIAFIWSAIESLGKIVKNREISGD
jgi:glycosyltransferase involved in cell wall biosynthesis